MMPKKIFISYSLNDIEKVKRIKKDIEQDGHRIWIYPQAIEPGVDIVKSEKDGIEESDFVIIMLSRQSRESKAVSKEIRLTKEVEKRSGKKKLLYARLDSAIPLKNNEAIQISDFSNDDYYPLELHKLLRKIDEHRNYRIIRTVERYLENPGWFYVKLELSGNLEFVKEVDYHLHPDLIMDKETKDNGHDIEQKFSIEFYTEDPEIVYAVVWLGDGMYEEIREFVKLH